MVSRDISQLRGMMADMVDDELERTKDAVRQLATTVADLALVLRGARGNILPLAVGREIARGGGAA